MKGFRPFHIGAVVLSDAIKSSGTMYLGPIIRSKKPQDKDQVRLSVLVYVTEESKYEQVGLAHIALDSSKPDASEEMMQTMLEKIEGGEVEVSRRTARPPRPSRARSPVRRARPTTCGPDRRSSSAARLCTRGPGSG